MSIENPFKDKKEPVSKPPKPPKEPRSLKPLSSRAIIGVLLFLILIAAIVIAVLVQREDEKDNNNTAQIVETSVAGTQTANALISPPTTDTLTPDRTDIEPTASATRLVLPTQPASPSATSEPTETQETEEEPILPPSNQAVRRGSTFPSTLHINWGWVCSGDFVLTSPSGETTPLYDSDSKTGLVVIIQANTNATLFAGEGDGYCRWYTSDNKSTIEDITIRSMLNDTSNCENGCNSVNIIEVDIDGDVTRDLWQPDQSTGFTFPTTPSETAQAFGGLESHWQRCEGEPNCWEYRNIGVRTEISVPTNCVRQSDNSIDGWRVGGGLPETADSIENGMYVWTNLEVAVIRNYCR